MRHLILTLAGLALLLGVAGSALAAGETQAGCGSNIAIGRDEYVILKPSGEVLLLPIDGEIGVRILPGGQAEQFRFRSPEGKDSIRADVTMADGAVLRGLICSGCSFYPGDVIPTSILSNHLLLQMPGVVYQVPLRSLMSIETAGAGQWKIAFRSGETVTGRLTLPQGVDGLSMTTEFGLVRLPLDKITSVTIMAQGKEGE